MKTFFQLSRHFSVMKNWRAGFGLLTLLSAIAAGIVYSQSALPPLPLIDLPAEPLYMNGAKTKGNLTLALSVEKPTVGQTYRDTYDSTKKYVGYFDPMVCYRQVPASSGSNNGSYFDVSQSAGKATLSSRCSSSEFDGNFMNWATSSAIDIFRYGLTGGNRTTDTSNDTVIERAWLPDDFYRNANFFSEKFVPLQDFNGRTELYSSNNNSNNSTTFPNGGVWIYNCRNRVYFAKTQDTGASSTCANPFGIPAESTLNTNLVGNSQTNYYEIRSLVCDTASAPNRLMTYDATAKQWSGLCLRYPSGKYKPVGQLQVNADSLRVSVFGYLQGETEARYGGVMRSPLKYVGPNAFDQNFNLVAGTNPRSEWNLTTGVFTADPQNGDTTYGNQGYPLSGAINYINRFGTLAMDPSWTIGSTSRIAYQSNYKTNDPISELYYEALRYLQGNSLPTASATVSLTGSASTDKVLTENFPAYRAWSDPFFGFVDDSGAGKGCLRNSIVSIADAFTTYDRSVPGNTVENSGDFSRGAVASNPPIPALNVPFWTSVVGGFESGIAIDYNDSKGMLQTTSNLATNIKYSWLSDAATRTTGAGAGSTTLTLTVEGNAGGSYHLAGMAYWANTQSFRNDFPKARVKTFAIDVDQGSASSNGTDFRRTRQIYLSAKYGGFDDSQTNNSGNPYLGGNNLLWQGSDGDAKNYFLASDAQKFLDSLSELFARVVEETGSIAGGAISTQRLTVGQAGAVFQARFNPVANFWSGKLLKFPLSLDSAGTSLVIGGTETWEAGKVLTTDAAVDNGAARKIVIGSPMGAQATVMPTSFTWADLAQAHKDNLNKTPYSSPATTDTLGINRLGYLRGSRVDEIKPSTPAALFRPRDSILGDIVNSGLVYMGKPSTAITGAGYNTFFNANKTRRPVVFVNANDGMLHAFYDSDGKEAFAYIPGFVAGALNKIPDQDYAHFSINDATPAVSEASVDTNAGSEWRSVLVSGVGAGGQGLYALDVTDPANFSHSKVMWEFTDRDSPEMGNVIGTPKILKMRTSALNATPPKYYAVVASGANNYKADGYASTTGNPSIFIIDLSRKPSDFPTEAPWTEGRNFWRIELPQTSTAIAKGLVGFSTVENFQTGVTESLYAGDLQGNVWKLDFSLKGTDSLTDNASLNLTRFNFKVNTSTKFFVALDSAGTVQPISGEPVISNGFFDSKLVSFGTGKYLEVLDTSVPSSVTNSFYTLLDKSAAVSSRSVLQAGSVSSSGTVTVPAFVYGTPPTTGTSTLKLGWYVDLDRSIGERQISDITGAFGQLFFGSLFPTIGACGEGGGRFYAVNALTGNGISELSAVGILAAPLILEIGNTALTNSDTTGQRTAMRKIAVITQGSKGLKVAATGGGGLSYSQQVGRVSWRQLNNFQENKNN